MYDEVKCNLYFLGKKHSVHLEREIYDGLKEIAKLEKVTVRELCSLIARTSSDQTDYASAVRVFVCSYYRNLALVLPKYFVDPEAGKTKKTYLKSINRR